MAFWRSNANSFKDAQDLCVGSWNEQESYPYSEYLLEGYCREMGKAYDFGCGVGRMMKHMLYRFEHVDGGELVPENIAYAKEYLEGNVEADRKNFRLFQLDGKSAFAGEAGTYDFVYSTIVIHHIAPFEVREQIYKDFLTMLKPGGLSVLSWFSVLIRVRIGLIVRMKKYFQRTRLMFQFRMNLIFKRLKNG